MTLPFSIEQFFQVFADYNTAIWPAQIFAYLLAFVAVGLAFVRHRLAGRVVAGILAVYWIWMGAVYHLLFFAAINPAATAFGVFFVLQGLLFLVVGTAQGKLGFDFVSRPAAAVGAILILYAMVGYPLLGAALGHEYPAAPMFGVAPCPTTIFTFGILLWAVGTVPRFLLVVPLLWAAIGTIAALQLNVLQDYGLAIAGVAAALLTFPRARLGAVRAPQVSCSRRGSANDAPRVVESANTARGAVSARRLGLLNDAGVTSSLSRYPLERITAPTLAISARDDLFGTFDSARYAAEHIPNARFVGYERGRHVWIGHHEDVMNELAGILK